MPSTSLGRNRPKSVEIVDMDPDVSFHVKLMCRQQKSASSTLEVSEKRTALYFISGH